MAVLAASPAVDAIPPGAIGCGTDITTDQRGQHRPGGTRCDGGAFELAQTPGQIVVDTAADEQQPNGMCSLREAIVNANQNSQAGSPDCAAGIGNDTIVFELGSPSATIILSPQLGALPTASDPRGLTIDGGSASAVTVSGGNTVRVFEVDTGDQLALANLTVANGDPGPNGFFGGGGVSTWARGLDGHGLHLRRQRLRRCRHRRGHLEHQRRHADRRAFHLQREHHAGQQPVGRLGGRRRHRQRRRCDSHRLDLLRQPLGRRRRAPERGHAAGVRLHLLGEHLQVAAAAGPSKATAA